MQKANTYVRFAYIGTYFDLMRYIPFGSVILHCHFCLVIFLNNDNP